MCCVLRASGPAFDVDAFLRTSDWKPCAVYHQGDKRYPRGEKRCDRSGFNLDIGDVEEDDLDKQIEQSIDFLRLNEEEITRLRHYPGLESMGLDFGVDFKDSPIQSYRFPAVLVGLAGALGLELEVTLYPTSDSESDHVTTPT